MNLQQYFKIQTTLIDQRLQTLLPKVAGKTAKLHLAMRYAVLSPGKRIRPILALAACSTVGGNSESMLSSACALELIHSYSLVHDDLPCMDDDDFRRGKASCHKKFGETTAVLAGDALLTLAFEILSRSSKPSEASRYLLACQSVAKAVGSHGMVGGQAVDMNFQNKKADLTTLKFLTEKKTADLISVSTKLGAILGGASVKQIQILENYGRDLGFLFQLIDDILDNDGYVRILGVHKTKANAEVLAVKAKKSLAVFGNKANRLLEITDFVLYRKK